MSLARGSAISRPSPVPVDTKPQSWATVGSAASATSGGRSASVAKSGPASRGRALQAGSTLSREATTHPADPAPTTITSGDTAAPSTQTTYSSQDGNESNPKRLTTE